MNGFLDGARELLDAGAHVSAETRMKETPLISALETRQVEMVQFLIEVRSDVGRIGLRKRTPLFYTCDPESGELLINAGADVNAKSDDGSTPLHQAANEGYADVVQMLIDHGAMVNAVSVQKQTALHVAAEKGHADVCEVLLNNQAELKVLDLARRSPEMLARRNEHYDVLSVITKYSEGGDDEDSPLLVFKPFSGVFNAAAPPPGATDVPASDFKFNIAPE